MFDIAAWARTVARLLAPGGGSTSSRGTPSKIIMALINAGLRIERFTEHRDEYFNSMPRIPEEQKSKIPRTFSLLASRPL
ncbi:hypothetical protein ACFWPX_04440 [Nocardia sp. NPDC058518]|uniref:hypothetical protein n=1 Tax=Nocardia sp. NPDC058518 TaxID=3346534 RepID=UPI003669D26D